jgi:hypothetical protein
MGYESCYVKLGGDNIPRYVAPYYGFQVGRSRAVGMRTGHYWIPNALKDPVGAADFFVNNLRDWTGADFAVLDNESLDGAQLYSDSQAAAWVNRVKSRLGIPARQIKVYLGLAVARSKSWPALLGTGCDFIIAAYGYAPFTFTLGTIPAARIKGHQYSSSGVIGGTIIDLNSWKADAFAYGTATSGTGTITPIPDAPIWRKKSMTTGYWTSRNGVMEWALAGDGGGAAAWIKVTSQSWANDLAAVHGSFVELSPGTFDNHKSYYLSGGVAPVVNVPAPVVNVPAPVINIPAPIVNVSGDVGVDMQPVIDAIKALPAEYLAALKASL